MRTGANAVRDTLTISTVEQIQALGHPVRQHVLRLLTREPMTNKQMATRIGIPPGKLHFHVRELERAGLIELVEERPKGGVIEKYYRAVAHNFTGGLLVGEAREGNVEMFGSALDAARQEYARAVERYGYTPPITTLVHHEARLTAEGAKRIQALIEAVTAEMTAADTDPNSTSDETHSYLFTALFHTMAEPDPANPFTASRADSASDET